MTVKVLVTKEKLLLQLYFFIDFCRTPGYKMGRCVSIFECDYLYKILTSKSLTQQSITFLKMSQCDSTKITGRVPHVCCARNDDSLMLGQNDAGAGILDKSLHAPSAISSASSYENTDDSIVYKSSNSLLPKTNECGREKIENRIYSGQVSFLLFILMSLFVCWQILSFTNCKIRHTSLHSNT